MEKSTLYLIDALIVACFVIMCMAWLFSMKRKYQIEARNKVRVEFRTPEGNSWHENLPVSDGLVELLPKKDRRSGKTFAVNDESTFDTLYPEGWCPSYLQTKMRKATIRTDTLEPISRLKYTPIMTPEMLFDVRNQRYGEVAVVNSQVEAEAMKEIKTYQTVTGNKLIWVFMGVLVVAIGVLVYLYYQQNQAIELLHKATGT